MTKTIIINEQENIKELEYKTIINNKLEKDDDNNNSEIEDSINIEYKKI